MGIVNVSIEDVLRTNEQQLMDRPNVTGVGIGEKGDKEVIKVLVTHKVPESELRPEDVIPREIDGFETDVDEIGVVTAQGK